MTIEHALPEPANPVGIDGIEFVEYATPQPQEFGALLRSWASRRSPGTARAR